jgi:hypothetical protein
VAEQRRDGIFFLAGGVAGILLAAVVRPRRHVWVGVGAESTRDHCLGGGLGIHPTLLPPMRLSL